MMSRLTPSPRDLGGLSPDHVEAALVDAAQAAANETLPLFRTTMSVANKHATGFDPVTEADTRAERAIRDVISRHFPDHAITGEEEDDKETGSPWCWIIDPVDGTRAFISGVPVWGTLIGLTHEGRAVAGIMSQPFIGETFIALPGMARYRNGETVLPLKASGVTELADARLFTTTPALFHTKKLRDAYDAVENAALQVRYGCDCYGYALLAAGHADLVVEAGLNSYDIAALIPIIEEAGGVIATWDGGRADKGGDVVAAASEPLLEATLRLLRTSF